MYVIAHSYSNFSGALVKSPLKLENGEAIIFHIRWWIYHLSLPHFHTDYACTVHLRVLLLETLGSGFGVGGTALKWFTSYLSQRTQQVQIKGTLSEKKQLTTGVPQGSCLGPVLFTIYVADLFQIIEESTSQKPRAMPMTIKFTCNWDPFLPRIKQPQSLPLKIVWQNWGAGWFPTCLWWMTARQNSWLYKVNSSSNA